MFNTTVWGFFLVGGGGGGEFTVAANFSVSLEILFHEVFMACWEAVCFLKTHLPIAPLLALVAEEMYII